MSNYRRVSKYVPVADGTRLAVDIYLPETGGKTAAIVYAGRNTRRQRFAEQQSFLEDLLANGYAVVLPDLRGAGASFGRSDGFHGRQDAKDMKCLMESLVQEDWSDGNFGMFGGSNCGFIQDLTAAERPSSLRAVIPCDCHPDFYYQDYPNGASRHIDFVGGLKDIPVPCEPVDEDTAGSLYAQAQEDHKTNRGFLGEYLPNMHRDTVNPALGKAPLMENTIWHRMGSIEHSGIKYYKNGAWYDPGAAGAILAHKVFDGKLLIGPWRHCEIFKSNKPAPEKPDPFHLPLDMPNGGFEWEKEYIRFFDAAIYGKDNGCFDEPKVRYYTRSEAPEKAWKYAADFPLDTQQIVTLYMSDAESRTIDSCFDGSLSETPVCTDAVIPYKTNPDIALFGITGTLNRRLESSFRKEAKKCLTFTTEKFDKAFEITGIPALEMEVTSDCEDGLFLAVLEEVYEDGTTCFISDGAIRASHAKTGFHQAYLSMGLPYHPGMGTDLAKLDEKKPLHLDFAMEAISQIIQVNSRLRLSVFTSEIHYQQPECVGSKLPQIGLHIGKSMLKLPVIGADVTCFNGMVTADSCSGEGSVYVFKRGIYVQLNNTWKQYPCIQVYPLDDNTVVYKTEKFDVLKITQGPVIRVSANSVVKFDLTGTLPDRKVFADSRPWLHAKRPYSAPVSAYDIDFKDQWVATVAVAKCQEGFPNIGPYNTMDLYLNLKLPKIGSAPYPCIVGIHGHGGDYDCFDPLSDNLLDAGFAVASIDYRATPPNRWPSLLYDSRGAIRFLKKHADRYGLDPERFGIIGCSCGGHLSAFIAATNGNPDYEGDIGGNTEVTSHIKAAAIYFPWSDALTFGEDIFHQYPGQLDKVMNSDGEFAPPGYMIDFSGVGKGMSNLKAHLGEAEYRDALLRAIDISPVNHVSETSAPCAIVHGIFEYGIQIPMNQSVRFFEALTRKNIKSLLFCNNMGPFGSDPEVQLAVVEFLKNQVL